MRVGRRQASYKGSPDSDAVRAFLCLRFSAPQASTQLDCASSFMSRLRLSHASTRDIKRLRFMVSVRKAEYPFASLMNLVLTNSTFFT